MRRNGWLLSLAAASLVAATLLNGSEAAARPRKKARKTKPVAAANFDTKLPVIGTHLGEFPAGAAKAIADHACLACHSADMILQQHLTEKQWTAEVTKMMGWGAEVSEEKKPALIAYLVENFGPANDKFQPVTTRPVGK